MSLLSDAEKLQLVCFDAGMFFALIPLRMWESWMKAGAAYTEALVAPSAPVPAARPKRGKDKLYPLAAMRLDHIWAGDPPGMGRL